MNEPGLIFMTAIVLVIVLIAASGLWIGNGRLRKKLAAADDAKRAAETWAATVHQENEQLGRFRGVLNAEQEAARLRGAGQAEYTAARQHGEGVVAEANRRASETLAHAQAQSSSVVEGAEQQAVNTVAAANQQAMSMVSDARRQAEQIAGDALSVRDSVEEYRREAKALKNVIEGYGDQYIVPAESVLDDLADAYGFTEAGESLKKARQRSTTMAKSGQAATCDYVEANRRETAIAFVVDAFTGKVDSILSRVKEDNVGTLRQKIVDAFALVNKHGQAFRNARVLDQYLQARLEELKWAAAAQELKNREREEQRRIKEQLREEEKARREFERAIRDAEKEEEALKKAMEKVQREVAKASDAQRAQYEAQLAELALRLKAAEEKNQRALSMAQQTKTGHVYVISNVGSFGEDVMKIGLTRRLEPLDRVHELGDASVPFEFDVHAMILSNDAPALEHALHRHFLAMQMNKVNPRKEFFRVPLTVIRQEIEKLGIQASWTMRADAAEYRQSLAIEKMIRDNPASYEAWVNKQLVLDVRAEAVDERDLAEAS